MWTPCRKPPTTWPTTTRFRALTRTLSPCAASSGWVSADQSEIRLQGEVKANGPADDVRPVTMNTDHLSVYPRQNRASTDAVVTIVQPGSILRGRGFAVSTLTKRYVLRSEVQSTHAPSSH